MKKLILILILCLALVGCNSEMEPEKLNSNDENSQIVDSEKEVEGENDIKNTVADIVVLKMASIPEGEHKSRAEVDINDDNTVVLYDFYYDGKAPDVYIAVGDFDENGNFVKGELISELIEGVYEGAEYRFNIPNEVDLNKYTAISIYCDRYSEDFASAKLININ